MELSQTRSKYRCDVIATSCLSIILIHFCMFTLLGSYRFCSRKAMQAFMHVNMVRAYLMELHTTKATNVCFSMQPRTSSLAGLCSNAPRELEPNTDSILRGRIDPRRARTPLSIYPAKEHVYIYISALLG
jgi:hypothetical protein